MSSHTLRIKLTPRTGIGSYNVKLTPATLEILALIFEFKLAASWHITRFLSQKERSRYTYTKLRRMWQSGLLESFKLFTGSLAGVPLYYILSKQGLKLLGKQGLYEPSQLQTYPQPKTLLSWRLFEHEAEIVNLASLESLNKTNNLNIMFKGEMSSKLLDYMNDKHIEVLTPDYTVVYKLAQGSQIIYTEFERTYKSHEAMLNKIQRYYDFFSPQDNKKFILRLVFQTVGMEKAFWLNIFTNRPTLLRLNIVTTNVTLILGHKDFLKPIYASESTVDLTKVNRLKTEISYRIKLFNFL